MTSVLRILAAVDFGHASEHALRVAGAIGRALGAEVTALHAETFDAPPYFTLEQLDTLERERDRLWRAAADHITVMARRVGAPDARPRVVDGPAAAAILAAAESADLVVMGTHGRRGPQRWWLGSVAERVLRETPRPLLVVRAGEPGQPAAEVFSRVLLLQAVTAEGREAAADWAGRLAAALGGSVSIGAPPLSCSPGTLDSASLVVVPLPGPRGDQRLVSDAVTVLRTCARPVLFVP